LPDVTGLAIAAGLLNPLELRQPAQPE
ncbi:MAG TPA: DNA-binding response regulator, partial [Marinobacter hydrocarbonoclasticus]|nr:DNA-binding response regulator [Marinobacter nauticus]